MDDAKTRLTQLLMEASEFSMDACSIILQACANKPLERHGSVMWSLMDTEGTPPTISGEKLFVYLQNYFCGTLYLQHGLDVHRFLTDSELAYLVAVAAHGMSNFLTMQCH